MTHTHDHVEGPYSNTDPYDIPTREALERDAKEIIARYPKARSALLPMLHLVQSVDGHITQRGIDLCAELLGITPAQVTGVATFYTQYKREPVGEYHVGVCINTLCAVMGGDQIWSELSEHVGVGHDEVTPDGTVSLERIECNAACDFAPVMTVNWEFFDDMTPEKAKQLVDDLRAGRPVVPSRGPDSLCSWKQACRVLAGFPDGRAHEGVQAGPQSLRGLELAIERGWTAPDPDADRERPDEPVRPEEVSDPPPNEPGKPIGGEVKPGSQEGTNR
ncbi:NADH-quinone oxidoreductase subunit NuoE [Actinomadura flavalba]|uniref:NADH-quinone oxidoreductase subunit NuoE n=1 Tax=Actinomadura flavalba TaxID=1120938 RepID=UPI000373FFCF|nr:NADH-quinone oxidoreductase subunit NuoE [Actinomadura flavalba]